MRWLVDKFLYFTVARALGRPERALHWANLYSIWRISNWPMLARYAYGPGLAILMLLAGPWTVLIAGAPACWALILFSYGLPRAPISNADAQSLLEIDASGRPEYPQIAEIIHATAKALGIAEPRASYIKDPRDICGAGINQDGSPWVLLSTGFYGLCESNSGIMAGPIAHEIAHLVSQDRRNSIRVRYAGVLLTGVVAALVCGALALALPGGWIAALGVASAGELILKGTSNPSGIQILDLTGVRLICAYAGRRDEFAADALAARVSDPAALAAHLLILEAYARDLDPVLDLTILFAALGDEDKRQVIADIEALAPMSYPALLAWLARRGVKPHTPPRPRRLERLRSWWEEFSYTHPRTSLRVARLNKLANRKTA